MRVSPKAISLPQATPTKPPLKQSATASSRNCTMIARPVAPTALRRPISRVRSLTETSMMFMIPMPPTSRLMPTIPLPPP